MNDFEFWCDRDLIRVRFVSAKALGRLQTGHGVGGDYKDRLIRLPRWETRRAQQSTFMHEFGHYAYDRSEMTRSAHEEEIVELFTWLPVIMYDKRNAELRAFLEIEWKDVTE